MFSIPGAINLINTIAAYTSPLFIASTIMLFTPDSLLKKVGLMEMRNSFNNWIGIVFIVSFSFLFSSGISFVIKRFRSKGNVKRLQRLIISNLECLTPEEKSYLVGYIRNQTQTQNFEIYDGVASGLQSKKIIYRSSNIVTIYGVAFNIQPFAYQYLMQNPYLLGVAK